MIAEIQKWQDRALPKCGDAGIDEAKLTMPIIDAIPEHYQVLLPILARLAVLCDVKAAKVVNRFFERDEQTKGEAKAEIEAWRDIQRMIENLIPRGARREFDECRKRAIS